MCLVRDPECGVDADGLADPDGCEVLFKGATYKNGGRGTLGCDNGEQLGLGPGKRRRGCGEACFGDGPDHLDGRW